MRKENRNDITILRVFKNTWWITILFIISCAEPIAPTGGDRDKKPPVITHSYPENGSIHFQQKEVKIVFDEWIQPLQNPQNQIIISPAIEPFPAIEAIRNELHIQWKDTLAANTTYSFFFGDNIKDNNEGNIYPDYKYIFSTGNHIDSLFVEGIIQTSLDKIPDNTYLLLYKEKEDSAFTKKRPFYISKISATGNFKLENVKNGDYRIYALSDKNSNYFYDLPTEAIGFTDSVYHINGNLDTLSFELFMPEDSVLRLADYEKTINGGIMHLTFNKELSFNKDQITVEVANNKDIAPIAFQEKEKGKLSIFFTKMEKDTNSLTLILKDNGKFIDSLFVRSESKNYKKPITFFNDTTAYKSLNVIETQPLKLVAANYSLLPVDSSKITITDTTRQNISFHVTPSDDWHTYSFFADWKPGMVYKLQLADSAIVDLVGNYSKKQDFSFSAVSVKNAGNLLINYELPQKNTNYIVLLKDNSGKVLDRRILRDSQAVKINYGLQLAGTYNVEVIEDINKNGIWNSGDFATKTLPEKIYKESQPIIIKENWDAEENIIVNFNKKDTNIPNASDPKSAPMKPEDLKMFQPKR